MAFKTVLTALTDRALADKTVAQAAAIARGFDAHLDVVGLGVDRTQTGYYYAGANAMILQETLNRAKADADALSEHLREEMKKHDCRWSVEEAVSQLADIGRTLASRARFSDLVVLPAPYGEGHGVELEPMLEGALFEGHAPVMVLPEDGEVTVTPKRVVVGWNESNEALNAVRAALPMLKTADAVHVVVIDPPAHSANRSDPGGMLAQWLSRHGVKCEIDVLSKTMPRVSDVMMRHVDDIKAEMLVMGAYSHSRFREAILGGATRSMLEQPFVPVFMAH